MPLILGAGAFLFFVFVLLGCFILGVTQLNGYTLLLLAAAFAVGRFSKQYRIH